VSPAVRRDEVWTVEGTHSSIQGQKSVFLKMADITVTRKPVSFLLSVVCIDSI